MDQEQEIARLRALVNYAIVSMEGASVMLTAAEDIRQAPLREMSDAVVEVLETSGKKLHEALGDAKTIN
ncbi:hypothetical protein AWB80_06730 [Caballeronia pedi]|uniref:Uncharacterized protein n=1 Tax=Caballeronia pedi TaxID=1777141 RepID=A0A158DE29_9BURK|nr:hypothetical protein [Caballeronia pedi]SAK92882.1 hypothetical protein AWB80_06730 [Caballeronia pedi]